MRKKIIAILFLVVTVLCIAIFTLWNSEVNVNTRNLEKQLASHAKNQQEGYVKNLIPFTYDQVYVFEPYQTKEQMEAQLGFTCRILKETINEGILNILYLNNHSPVANLYGYPSNIGCSIEVPTGMYTKEEWNQMKYTVETSETVIKYLFQP